MRDTDYSDIVELYKEFLDLQNQFENTLNYESKLKISKELDRVSDMIDTVELII